MGAYSGPEVNENGLVLALDAGNSKGFDDDENYILNSTNLYNSCFETNGSGSDGDGTYVTYQDGGNKGYLGSIAPTGEISVRLKTPANYGGYSKQRTFFNINFPSSTECTASIFYKNDPTNPIPSIRFWGQNTSGPNQGSIVTVSLTGSPGVSYGNGWYRLTVNLGTSPSTNNFNFFSLLLDSNYSNNRYCEFAGFQVEKGSSASPYYPTTSTAKIRGTTLIDMTGRGNTGTLTNGPTYSSANGGSIVFDGTNDYAEVTTRNTNLEFQPTQPYSVFCWIYNLTGSAGAGTIISNMDNSGTYPGWDLWINGTTEIAAHLISSWSGNATKVAITFDYAANANKWVNIGYTYNGTSPANATNALNSINFYVNGVLTATGKYNASGTDGFNTTAETISYNSSQRLRVASRWTSGGASFPSPFRMSNTQIYNRALTAAEVQQNFNALRGRYGI